MTIKIVKSIDKQIAERIIQILTVFGAPLSANGQQYVAKVLAGKMVLAEITRSKDGSFWWFDLSNAIDNLPDIATQFVDRFEWLATQEKILALQTSVNGIQVDKGDIQIGVQLAIGFLKSLVDVIEIEIPEGQNKIDVLSELGYFWEEEN